MFHLCNIDCSCQIIIALPRSAFLFLIPIVFGLFVNCLHLPEIPFNRAIRWLSFLEHIYVDSGGLTTCATSLADEYTAPGAGVPETLSSGAF